MRERLSIQLVENALREDLKPIEQARAYKTLMETHGWSGNQLAKELHIAQASVVKALALLDLPEQVQNQIDRGELAASVAYEVSKLPRPRAATRIGQCRHRREADPVRSGRSGQSGACPPSAAGSPP